MTAEIMKLVSYFSGVPLDEFMETKEREGIGESEDPFKTPVKKEPKKDAGQNAGEHPKT
jgi:hypothetical protein